MTALRILAEAVHPGIHPSQELPDSWFGRWNRESASGIQVTPELALTISAVYACVTLYADTIGSLPVHSFTRGDRSRTPLTDHPAASLVGHVANPELTAKEFWSQITGWKLMRGNALAYIESNNAGQPVALWPIPWTRVTPARTTTGALAYIVHLSRGEFAGQQIDVDTDVGLLADEVLHWRDFGLGPVGMSRISYMAETAGIALAAEEHDARFFANDATPGGYITVSKTLDDDEWETMRKRWNSLHQGTKRSHMMGILENADWKQAGISPKDAQLLELRGFQVEDIARWFRMPLHMLQIAKPGAVSYASVEQFGIEWVRYSLAPHLTRLEDVTSYGLFDVKGSQFMRFGVDGLLRGDTAARYAAYAIGRQWGFLSVNDIRRLEDMEPIGADGDIYLEPQNMAPAGPEVVKAIELLGRLGSGPLGQQGEPLGVTGAGASGSVNGNGVPQ